MPLSPDCRKPRELRGLCSRLHLLTHVILRTGAENDLSPARSATSKSPKFPELPGHVRNCRAASHEGDYLAMAQANVDGQRDTHAPSRGWEDRDDAGSPCIAVDDDDD